MDKARPTRPVLAGVIPIKSVKMAKYLNERVPGIEIPASQIEEIQAAGSDENQIEAISIDIAARTVRSLRSVARGVHIMAIGWEGRIPAILEQSHR
jgi:5,10-methylenetetrahydrofolate reductase